MINVVYLYNDKYTVIFNAADKSVKVMHSLIDEIEAATEKFVYEQDCFTLQGLYEPLFLRGGFAVTVWF